MPKPPAKRKQESMLLRVIGGELRGRKFRYSGDPGTRPMKDRVREAVFNLVGPAIRGAHAIDLFAGTGAVALEAISRGAAHATALERNFEMVRLIQQNARDLGVDERIDVVPGNTFVWLRQLAEWQQHAEHRWAVFCCPPYQLYRTQWEDLRWTIEQFQTLAPPASMLLVEADTEFDFQSLPQASDWDVRDYPPARVGLQRLLPPS